MSNPFELEARRSFDGLAQQFGMDCVRSSNREVRYESGNTFLSVNFDDGRSYEVGVEIGQLQLSQPERPFTLAEILRRRGVADAASIDGMMVSDSIFLPDAMRHLAQLTSNHASDFLKGGDVGFAEVAKLRKKESDAYALEVALSAARAQSDAAWKERDYQGVIQSLEPLEKHLSSAERMRLNYSRHQLIRRAETSM